MTESHTQSLDARQCYAGPARQAAKLDAANVPSKVDVEPHIILSSPMSGARNTMPALPSPPASNTPQGHQKVPSGSRPSTAAGSGSRGYRPQQNGGSNGVKQTRARGGEEAGQRPSSRMAPSARDGGPREKPPSKDGTVQRTAKEVEGLKDFVCEIQIPTSIEWTWNFKRRSLVCFRARSTWQCCKTCSATQEGKDATEYTLKP